MVVYTRDNIEGIVFNRGCYEYKIVKSLPKMHLKRVDNSWKDLDYDANYIIEKLNNGTYKVIEQPIKIYELW